MVEHPNPEAALIAVDDDVEALRRTTRELVGRYGSDYRVVCQRSAGDVRHGSTPRVASAVGDGAVVVGQIHRLLEPSEPELEAAPRVDQRTPA